MALGDTPYGLIKNGTVAVKDDMIAWVGRTDELPDTCKNWPHTDLQGRLITPGLIDCHTHIIYGGNRAEEFEMRLGGASYEEIARAGGGILSTVTATRQASEAELLNAALPRIDNLIAEGVTTLEIKTGYGLDASNEIKMLRAARRVSKIRALNVRTTYLGAHAVPPDFKGRADAYIDEVVIPTLEAAHSADLVDAVDGFCENIAFSTAQMERVFKVAQTLGFPIKLHAEQLSNQNGAALAAQYNALSADHLEFIDEPGVQAMAQSGTVAVMLPGAFYTLRDETPPPIDLFRRHNVPMAVATDCNPGSSPLSSLLLAMNMACTLFRLTPEEALAGTTRNAAQALGLSNVGQIKTGLRADLAIWDVNHPAELSYNVGFNPLHQRIFGGDI